MAQHQPLALRPEWLRLTFETAMEPGLPICDSHHHLWDHGPADRYLMDELLDDTGGGHNVLSTVFVESGSRYRLDGPEELKPAGETEFANGIAAKSARCSGPGGTRVAAGIVGRADLGIGAKVAAVLEAHRAASPRFKGIRHSLNRHENARAWQLSDAPQGQAYGKAFREGFACLANHGLSFDARLSFHQLPGLIDLARAFPDVPIALSHSGGVLRVGPHAVRGESCERWKRTITELAKCPNVFVKLGGLGLPQCGFQWHERPAPPTSIELAQQYRPYVLHCIEQFGPHRSMFASHFPADKIASSYTVLWNCFKWLTKDFTLGERAELFHDTAFRFYRLFDTR
jgi:L-fuconolactonase